MRYAKTEAWLKGSSPLGKCEQKSIAKSNDYFCLHSVYFLFLNDQKNAEQCFEFTLLVKSG